MHLWWSQEAAFCVNRIVDSTDEVTLVEKLKAGEEAAFCQVFETYSQRLYGFLFGLSRNHDLAVDLVQETWLRLIRSSASLRDDTSLRAWLLTVARNLYISHCRSRLIELERLPQFFAESARRESSQSPLEVVVDNDVHSRLEEALAQLPYQYREALLLVGVEQLKPSLAAAVCGISGEAFRQRLHRGRKMLLKKMKTYLGSRYSEPKRGLKPKAERGIQHGLR